MKQDVVTIAVCGSVDHGKSTLLGRLLLETRSLPKERLQELKNISVALGKDLEPAFLIDQFKEERDQERTIDTAQVFLKTSKRRYCFVDTPGHVEFIKNMMTGATQADAALLLVDAADGMKEQTRRHANLLKLLGIREVIVVVNKMDKVGYAEEVFRVLSDEVQTFLGRLEIKPSAIVPVSAREGVNILKASPSMRWYRGPVLIRAIDSVSVLEVSQSRRPLRLPVQDVYHVDGQEVCVGRVESGTLKTGEVVVVWPSGREARVVLLKVFGKKKNKAAAQESIGLVVKNAALARGDVISSHGEKPILASCFVVELIWLVAEPLKLGDRVVIRCATQEAMGVVSRILEVCDSSTLETLEKDGTLVSLHGLARVELRCDTPLVLEKFDHIRELGRLVLEDQGNICAAGIVP